MGIYIWLTLLGFVIGTYGTLIGAGGGFVLVPILLMLYPNESPEIITSISLAVVFFNAMSGSLAYSRMKRIIINPDCCLRPLQFRAPFWERSALPMFPGGCSTLFSAF